MPLDVTCGLTEKVMIAIHPDEKVDGKATFSVTSGDGFTGPAVDAAGNPLLDDTGNPFEDAVCIMGDTESDTEFLVSVDADRGAGVVTLTDIVVLHVRGRQATTLGLTSGTAIPR